ERDVRVLADEQLDLRHNHAREALELGLHLVPAGGKRQQAVLPAAVGNPAPLAAVFQIVGRDRGSRQTGLRLFGDYADYAPLLGVRKGTKEQEREKNAGANEPSWTHVADLLVCRRGHPDFLDRANATGATRVTQR